MAIYAQTLGTANGMDVSDKIGRWKSASTDLIVLDKNLLGHRRTFSLFSLTEAQRHGDEGK
jgi:hypothetical protein